MEFIFECFYENTLDKLCRNGLQDRSSRRNVLDHLNAVIGGCSDGQNMHTEEVARIAVLAAVRYHREKKDGNGDICLMGKFHNIYTLLYELAGIGASEIQQLLWCCLDENTRAMVYFLHHATSLDMSLPVWIARYEEERLLKFIDVPIESCGRSSPLRVALQASAPDLLLILLRYGAAPNPPDGGYSVVFALLDKLIENGRNYVFQNISCLQILLRNIPLIEMPFKPVVLYDNRCEMFVQRYGCLLRDNIVPIKQVFGVMSLRHLCRCRIRDLLRSNGQLPDGIDTLRLPRRLQRYIDLMEEIEDPKTNRENDNECNKMPRKKNIKETSAKNPKTNTKKKQVAFKDEPTFNAKITDTEQESEVEIEIATTSVSSTTILADIEQNSPFLVCEKTTTTISPTEVAVVAEKIIDIPLTL